MWPTFWGAGHNHRGFLDHGAREVRAKCLGGPRDDALIPALYFMLSNHGRSILLPFSWLIAVIFFGTLFYASTVTVERITLLVASFIPIFVFPIWVARAYCNSKRADKTVDSMAILLVFVGIGGFIQYYSFIENEVIVIASQLESRETFLSLGLVLFIFIFIFLFSVLSKRFPWLWRIATEFFYFIFAVATCLTLSLAVLYVQATETSRAIATSVMVSLSITQLFRLFPGGIHEAVPCGMMALTPECMKLCLTTERGEFLTMVGNDNIRFIPGAYIVSGVQIFISSILLFLLGLGIRNRIKTG